jgi:hypothetical protein
MKRIQGIRERLDLLRKRHGLVAVLRHLLTRSFGEINFLRPSSLIDFRHASVRIVDSCEDFLLHLLPNVPQENIQTFLTEARELIPSKPRSATLSFPENWNSGSSLRIILFSLARILRPELVVETGTANGASADAWATALMLNEKGRLISIDIVETPAPLLAKTNRERVALLKTSGSMKELRKTLVEESRKVQGIKIFMHDSDHSYFGQTNDFVVAQEANFNLLLSDDVDSSMAFLEFIPNGSSAVVMIDGTKMIGALRLNLG